MIGTQILQGQGLGNRLFCYVTARSIAEQKKTSFGVPGKEILLNGLTGNNSEPFLDLCDRAMVVIQIADSAKQRLIGGCEVIAPSDVDTY